MTSFILASEGVLWCLALSRVTAHVPGLWMLGSSAYRAIIMVVSLLLSEVTTGHCDCCSFSLSSAQCRDGMALPDGPYGMVLPYLQVSVTQVV